MPPARKPASAPRAAKPPKTSDICPKCKAENALTAFNCSICGARLPWAETARAAASPPPVVPAGLPVAPAAAAPLPAGGATAPSASAAANAPNAAGKPPQIYDPNAAPAARGVVETDPAAAKKAQNTRYAIWGVMALIAFIGVFLGLRAMRPEPIQVPTAFAAFTTEDKSFACQKPEGWSVLTSGGTNGVVSGSTFRSGTAVIKINTDSAGSFMSEGMKRSAKSPVQQLHEMSAEKMQAKMSDYQEEPAKIIQGGFGETWISEFTAQGGWREGTVKGYRATALSSERRITYIAQCPVAEWDKLKPAYDTVLMSIGPGGAAP